MLPELLEVLGVGLKGQIAVSATLVVGALYVYRAAALARLVGALFGTLAGYAIMLCVASAVAIAAGWVDPNLGVIFADAAGLLDSGFRVALEALEGLRRWVG